MKVNGYSIRWPLLYLWNFTIIRIKWKLQIMLYIYDCNSPNLQAGSHWFTPLKGISLIIVEKVAKNPVSPTKQKQIISPALSRAFSVYGNLTKFYWYRYGSLKFLYLKSKLFWWRTVTWLWKMCLLNLYVKIPKGSDDLQFF